MWPWRHPWASEWNLSLHQASIQDTEAQSWREELEEAGLGEVTEITLGVAGWGMEGKDALEIQRP